ncbi:MAG: ATP-binding protein [Microthrixaceae bacterium]
MTAVLAVTVAVLLVAVVAMAARMRDASRKGAAVQPTEEANAQVTTPLPLAGALDGLGPLAAAVETIEHGVVIVNGNGVETYRNEAATRLATARHGHALVESCVKRTLGTACSGESAHETVELFGPPAELFEVSAHPFDDTTGTGALAIVEDRSEFRRTETVRRDFVANISHELKTPIGALGLLAETISDEDDLEVVRRLSERIISEADRAARTIDDLLELSRIEFADDATLEDLSLEDVVTEAVSRIATAAEQANVKVRTDVQASVVMTGDRRQLVSALFNLLDNAVKYSTDGDEVDVRAHLEADGRTAVVVVEDHGIGIPSRAQDRIFERFYRVDQARARNTGGTGLGLAIVRHVVVNHGGELELDSLEGRGSVFRLLLPCGDTTETLAKKTGESDEGAS